MWIVYVIQSNATEEIYIGKTNDLRRRILEHNRSHKGATQRKSGEWILVYAEAYLGKKDADIRELRLKNHGRAKQELYKRITESLNVRTKSGAGRS